MGEVTPLLPKPSSYKMPSSWYAIFPMVLVAFSGSALLAPHAQFYTEVFCTRYYKSQNELFPIRDCAIPEVHKLVSRAQALIMFLTYGSTLLGAGYYGRLSDIKGRVTILRISTLGTLIYVTCDLLTAKYHETIGISLLFIGPLIRGLMAGESVLMAAVQAYIADCTSPSTRTVVFARLMSSLFIGASIGPFVGSLILKHTGDLVNVFYAAWVVDLSNVMYTHYFVPESNKRVVDGQVTVTKKAKGFWERLNIFSALRILFQNTTLHMTKYALPCIALAEFLLTLVKRPPTLLYAMLKFKWTAYEGSIYYTFASLMRLFMMIGVLPLLSKIFIKKQPQTTDSPLTPEEKKLKNSITFDIWMVRIGIGIDAISLALAGLATNVTLFILAGMLQSFSVLAQPSIRSLVANLAEPEKVGELLGAVAILDSVGMIIAHLSVNTIYSASVETMPSLTFYICAVAAGCSCLSAFFVRKTRTEADLV
ncbi:major facilitator superfamily domain-containing protein [Pilaira anomala]|nr:major facilitator superfamily domain-containing protein [Pilaira anomala]